MRVAEVHGEVQLKTHSYNEFHLLLAALRSENATIAKAASKVPAAIQPPP
jgi:hypothetical protein